MGPLVKPVDYLSTNLKNLVSQLKEKKYQFGDAKGIVMQKKDGKKRPVVLPSVKARIRPAA